MAKPEQLLQIEPDTELKFRGKNKKKLMQKKVYERK